MLVIPAVDIIDGQCICLSQGSFDEVKVYSDDPGTVASNFGSFGAERLHVVDLDAVRGIGENYDTIARIRDSFDGEIQLGGGIRDIEKARKLLSLGIDWMVLGTVLVDEPALVSTWILELGAFFIAAIDCRDGLVKTDAWQKDSAVKAEELAVKTAKIGIGAIVYTDIARDGTMSGLDMEGGEKIARASSLDVFLSGGVGSMDDVRFLADKKPGGIAGVIIGKAWYEDRIDLPGAIEILS